MASDKSAISWRFCFWLEHQNDDTPVPEAIAEQLMDAIIEWVETRGLQVGGGFNTGDEALSNDKPF